MDLGSVHLLSVRISSLFCHEYVQCHEMLKILRFLTRFVFTVLDVIRKSIIFKMREKQSN